MLDRTTSTMTPWLFALGLAGLVGATGCSANEDANAADGGTGAQDAGASDATTDSATADLTPGPETPPTTAAALETWLANGAYKAWHCEPAPHASRRPSAHNVNRICSNDLTHGFSGTGERPVGSAGVKELYDADGGAVVGYAVYLKTKPTSAGGDNWYWYERVPLDSDAPHDSNGVVADGLGSAGTAKSICVGCHAAAGADTAHTPTPGASDQVYTQVQ